MSRRHGFSWWRCRGQGKRGGIAVQTALMLVLLLGFAALGTEIVLMLLTARHMQSAADSAAFSAATARTRGYPADYVTEANGVAAASGFPAGQDGTTVAVNVPPTQGSFRGNEDALEVIISQPQALPLVGLFRAGVLTVSARAVAVTGGTGKFCALSLNRSASAAVSANGTVGVNFIDCGLAVDSAAANALTLTGGASVTALQVQTVGGYSLSGGATLTASEGISTRSSSIPDPYAGVAVPPIGPCTKTGYKVTGGASVTLSPGVYCNGIVATGNSRIRLNPGTYIIDRGSLSVSGGSSLSGTGVTFVLTSSTGSNYATVAFSGGAAIDLTAPQSGDLSGLAFFQDRRAPTGVTNKFTGGTSQIINGALYLPRQTINYAGGGSQQSQCTQIIADKITFSGNATLRLNCEGMGTTPVGYGPAQLVE